ncbi:SPARC-related modular calcium-binding protein 1-like isoform X3 [Rhinatrema bivittatum]|uniref:SPARC-related modular calcium-binding protein 1-like isoform X3 n=1 Tax=Rhinatrema bivittatum TaxID=194408 RepID=UPI0011288703|nr:SPARC-related modular calcium-binding protein 1-like isoform X3 [Rhinatrema bivittatum]
MLMGSYPIAYELPSEGPGVFILTTHEIKRKAAAVLLTGMYRVHSLAIPETEKRFRILKFIISESDRGALCNMQCTRDRHKPICGSDGKLYKSLCAFQRAKCQNPLLEATPRSQCNMNEESRSRLTRNESPLCALCSLFYKYDLFGFPDASLTRCQEDRAAALAQARGPSHSVYVPECKEDGSFLQVQCHKQTGYCWCATTEGKPVSGTSVLNHTPNCTGPYPARPLWPDLNSSRRAEEVVRPQPTRESLPVIAQHKEEEGTSLPVLIPIIIPDAKPNRTVKRPQEYPPSCERERRDAVDEARQHQHEGAFIPECERDGSFRSVQCHQATGYCWCVRKETGKPIPGTSSRTFPPHCESDSTAKSAEMVSLYRERVLPGCPGAKKTDFLSSVVKALVSDMMQSRMLPLSYRRLLDESPGPTLEERVVRWHFVRLDKDFSSTLNEWEIRPFKVYVKKNTRPKRCVRKFMEYCDVTNDKLISLHELKGCLGLS